MRHFLVVVAVLAVAVALGCENTIVPSIRCARAVDCPDDMACLSGECRALPEGVGGDGPDPGVDGGPTGGGEGEGEGEPGPTCDPTHCDDGVFCNGVESCDDEIDACADGVPPCDADLCDETRDLCADPPEDEDAGFYDAGGSADAGAPPAGDDAGPPPPVDAGGCVPSCAGRDCGDDGCGGDCGACGEHQECDAAGQCAFVGDVCLATTDAITIGAFQTRAGSLSATTDEVYQWDRPYPRILDNFVLDVIAPVQTATTLTLTSADFDPIMYAYDDDGACIEVAKNDDIDGAANRDARFTLPAGTTATQILVTSFEEETTGAYTLTSTSTLCGLQVTAAVYAACAPKIATTSRPDPCDFNPCVNYGVSPDFCCVRAQCRTDFGNGNEIVIEQDPVGCAVP